MNLYEGIKDSFSTIKSNKLRSFLTMLGIIIGISSVIMMWSIGNGGKENILGDLKKIGYGKFTVTIDYKSKNFKYKDYFNEKTLDFLKKTKKFKAVSANIEENFRVKNDNKLFFSYAEIATSDFNEIVPLNILYGRNFLPFEYSEKEKVIIIDNISAKNIFKDEKSAIGKYIEIAKRGNKNGYNFKIIGVYKNPMDNLIKIFSDEENTPIFIRMPYEIYNTLYSDTKNVFDTVLIQVYDEKKMTNLMDEARELLEFNKNTKNVYISRALSNEIESFDKILSTLSIFITFAASISLFVGGIGVMNIMLVNVIERTKEIGIRKAIGAKNSDILKQFLFESVIITMFGGIIGIILGITLSIIIGKFIGIIPKFSIFSILISLSISILVGIIFGVSPAKKASNLNPIDALRVE